MKILIPESVLNDNRRSRCLIQYFAFAFNNLGQHIEPSSNTSAIRFVYKVSRMPCL